MKPIIIYESKITNYLNMDGLVLFPFVLISEKEEDTLPSVLKHELTHVKQIYRDGFCGFYTRYFCSVVKSLMSGKDIVHALSSNDYEQEAYELENTDLDDEDIRISGWKGDINDNGDKIKS